MDVTTQLESCLHEQTQIVTNASYRVVANNFIDEIANYIFVSLLFIAIPTPFLNF